MTPARLALVAGAVLPLFALVPLAFRSYRVTSCFQTATFGGCGTRLEPFSPAALPALIGVLVIALLCAAFAAAAARAVAGGALGRASVLLAPTIILTAVLSMVSSPLVFVPAAMLIGAFLWARSHDARSAAVDLALAIGLLVAGLAGSYALYVAFALVMSSQLSTGFAPVWWYAAFVSAAGTVVGVLRAPGEPSGRPLSRAILWAYLAAAAGGVVTTALWVMAFYPGGRYANPGKSGLFIGLVFLGGPAVVAMVVALRTRLGTPTENAVGAAVVAAVAFVVCSVAVLNVSGAFADGTLFVPPLPLLPNTSTR